MTIRRRIFCVLLTSFTLSACNKPLPSDLRIIKNPYDPNSFLIGPVPIDESFQEQDQYVPPVSSDSQNLIRDQSYMLNIKTLIETFSSEKDSSNFFFNLVATVAWRESSWQHYVKIHDELYVIAGDDGESIGMMQINKNYFDVYLDLKKNLRKGISLLHEFYIENKDNHNGCEEGSNAPLTNNGILRRIYASYNGGRSNRCRNNHENDNKIEEIFNSNSKPWDEF